MEIDGKQAAAAVFRFLGKRAPQGRIRTHRTEIPGQLDFSTNTSRGCIIHHDAAPTQDEIHAIVQRHHADNDTGKALMVFTTTEPRIGTRAFPWVISHRTAPSHPGTGGRAFSRRVPRSSRRVGA